MIYTDVLQSMAHAKDSDIILSFTVITDPVEIEKLLRMKVIKTGGLGQDQH